MVLAIHLISNRKYTKYGFFIKSTNFYCGIKDPKKYTVNFSQTTCKSCLKFREI